MGASYGKVKKVGLLELWGNIVKIKNNLTFTFLKNDFMIVEKIEIENFKRFGKEVVEFEPDLNIFIGLNGAGKTSLLLAIVKCLYSFTAFFADADIHYKLLVLENEDINYNEVNCIISGYLKGDLFGKMNPICIAKGL